MVAKGIYATTTLNNKTECCSGTILKIHNMNEKKCLYVVDRLFWIEF